MTPLDQTKQDLHTYICKQVFTRNTELQIADEEDPNAWIFDFRQILMQGNTADMIAEIFFQTYKDRYPFQIGTLEIAGVPLATSIMNKFYNRGYTDINSFFVRKSRKKYGLMRMVEGQCLPDVPVILVDDIMNRGNSFWRQVTVLDELEIPVTHIWSLLRFRDSDYYKRFTNRNIVVDSLFTLNDFTSALGDDITNLSPQQIPPPLLPFHCEWIYSGPRPSLHHVLPKSQPILDDTHIYVGSDDPTFRAINQHDGSIAWSYPLRPGIHKKSVASNPVLFRDTVIFGAYDGNVYALDTATGQPQWIFQDADWVASSPALAKDRGLIFVGLEFGLLHKHGGIVALNATSGSVVWSDYSHPAYTPSSPLYIEEHGQVVIGSNDGTVRLYDAVTGTLVWEFVTFGGSSFTPDHDQRFSNGDIKASCAYSLTTDEIIFGAIDGYLYCLDRASGHLTHHIRTDAGIWSTPLVADQYVYISSTDKHLYCLDLRQKKIVYKRLVDGTRLFATPVIINHKLYIGTNAGRLHELDPVTGSHLSYFQATERITNTPVYNPHTDRYFLPTYANQIICLSRNPHS